MVNSILVLSIFLSKFIEAAWVRGAVDALVLSLLFLPRYIRGGFEKKAAESAPNLAVVRL